MELILTLVMSEYALTRIEQDFLLLKRILVVGLVFKLLTVVMNMPGWQMHLVMLVFIMIIIMNG